MLEKKFHTITEGDELGLLLFNCPIPQGVWIYVNFLRDTFGISFPCKSDRKGSPIELDARTASLANEFTMTLNF